MPYSFEEIFTSLQDVFQDKKASIFRIARAVLIVAIITVVLEVFLFNWNYFASLRNNTIDLSQKLELQETQDGHYKLTEVNHTIEFYNLNTEVKNVLLDFDHEQAAQQLQVKIQFTDEAHQTYFDSTDYTEGVPLAEVATNCIQSEYINLQTTGLVTNLKIELVGDNISYPIRLEGVYLNGKHPFEFNVTRVFLVLAALMLVYIFRPKSSIYRRYITDQPRSSKSVIIATICVEVGLVATLLFLGSNLVGVATSTYNPGSWDGKSVVNSFKVGGENAQQYAELAKAFSKGQLYLDEEPPQWLQELEQPYDKGLRDEAQKATGEEYLFDVAYYEGKYYVYFGVVPVLLFYLPFYLVTGANFPTAIGVLIACIAFIIGCSVLLDRFARYHFKKVSLGLYLLLQIPLVLCCGILYLVKFPTFYSLPIMVALAFSVWGLYFWMKGRASGSPCVWYALGSLCMALVIGCRPQLVLLSFLAFPLFWRKFITEQHLFTRQGIKEIVCLLLPYALVIVAVFWYNTARFGSFLDFGANYNLTVNDMTKRGFNVGRLAPAFFSYFVQPPNITGVFPFVRPAIFETTYMGQTIKEVTFGGIFACLPILWILPFARRILAKRMEQRSTRTIAGVIMVLLVVGFGIALMDAQVAGILQRYYADFSIMFLMAAVLLAFIVNENLKEGSLAKDLFIKALIGLSALCIIYILLMTFAPETGWYSDVYDWAYQGVVEMMQFWT